MYFLTEFRKDSKLKKYRVFLAKNEPVFYFSAEKKYNYDFKLII